MTFSIIVTEAGRAAIERFDPAHLSQRRPRIAIEITPAGVAAVRDYELAFAIRKAPPLPDGVVSNWPAPDGPTPAFFRVI